jgi:hypothetical protein
MAFFSHLPSRSLEVDVVNTNTGTTDHLQSVAGGFQHLFGKFGGASNDDGVKGLQSTIEEVGHLNVVDNHLMTCFFKACDRLFVHPVGDGNPCHGRNRTRRR